MRRLIVDVTDKGIISFGGDPFTVGELEAIGENLIRFVKDQKIILGVKEAGAKRSPEGPPAHSPAPASRPPPPAPAPST